jgi:transposase
LLIRENNGGRRERMSQKIWIVNLTEEERSELLGMIKKGKVGGRKLNRAHILLMADEGKTDASIAEALHTGLSTVERTREQCVIGGLEGSLNEKARKKRGSKLNERGQALLVATACSQPPEDRARWTLKLLANRLVELKVVESISSEMVRLELKKTNSSPGKKSNGAFQKSAANL